MGSNVWWRRDGRNSTRVHGPRTPEGVEVSAHAQRRRGALGEAPHRNARFEEPLGASEGPRSHILTAPHLALVAVCTVSGTSPPGGRAVSVRVTAIVLAAMASMLGACTTANPGSIVAGTAAARPPAHGTFTGSVTIGGGRKIYLTCKGSGSPTVVLVSGSGGASDEWMYSAPTGHRVGEIVPRDLQRSRSAVFPTIARMTRVCAYDRPNTTSIQGRPTPSTPASFVDIS